MHRANIVTWTPTVTVQGEDGTVTHKTSLAANKQVCVITNLSLSIVKCVL